MSSSIDPIGQAVQESRKISFENWFPLMEWVRYHQKNNSQIDPDDLLEYIQELRDTARQPVKDAVSKLLEPTATKEKQ